MCYMGARREEREMLINCHISSHTLSFVPMSLMVCELSIFLSPSLPFLCPFYEFVTFYVVHFL